MELAKLLKRSGTGAERGSRVLQVVLNVHCERVCVTEDAPRDPGRILERRHGLAEIVERGAVGFVEHYRVIHPKRECEFMTLTENASRHGHNFAHECPGFFAAP